MNIQELKLKSSEQLITQAEELGIENASTLRKQEILFAILKKVAEKEEYNFNNKLYPPKVRCPNNFKKCPCLNYE